jgi:multidrug efflux pump subunit AcrB
MAAGEVFLPILSGTLTTLAPFFPLAFWPGIVGKFMFYMPVTLIITLFASLFVAYIINPVFAVTFMKHEYDRPHKNSSIKKLAFQGLGALVVVALFYLIKVPAVANIIILCLVIYLIYQLLLKRAINVFQNKIWPAIIKLYDRTLRYVLFKKRSYKLFVAVIILLLLSIVLVGIRKPQVVFFPENEPNSIMVFAQTPVGTHQAVTDSISLIMEQKVYQVVGNHNPDVESIVTNVGFGAGEGFFDRSTASNKAKITINFVEYKFRKGQSTTIYMDQIRDAMKDIPGVEIAVQKNKMGPPTGKPISIEVTSESLEDLIFSANHFKNYLDSLQLSGVEELKMDFQEKLPEIVIDIDRVRANREGISTGQIGMELRNAIYGKEISKYKELEDEFPIQMRYTEAQRKNINSLLDLKITYRDMTNGMYRQIPLSSLAKVEYRNTYGGINRKNHKRVITISSEVLSGYTANEVVKNITALAESFPKRDGVEIELTGEKEDQKDAMNFLMKAMLIALGLIFFILISQFNSLSKSLIILSEVIFSVIGVLLGIVIFGMSISVIMTGLGIVALGGIVVRNGILIVEFTDVLKAQGYKTRKAIIDAGKTRITPVILTATATMLGLVPLAVGMNINFITLFTELNPHIHFGGDNVMFWGTLSWTIIFGLSFATFLTLVFVPAMYLIAYAMKLKVKRRRHHRNIRLGYKD